jgi:hypothetical protein
MTEKDMDRLATIIVDKIAEKQKQLDKEFISELEKSQATVEVHVNANEIEKLEAQAFRLQLVLKTLEHKEQYHEAAECQKDLNKILDEIMILKAEQ